MKKILIFSLLLVMSIPLFSQVKERHGHFSWTLSKDTVVVVFDDRINFAGNTIWVLNFTWTSLNTTSAYIEPIFGLNSLEPSRVLSKNGNWYDTLQLNPASGYKNLYATILPTGALIFKVHKGTNATGTLRWDWSAIKQ